MDWTTRQLDGESGLRLDRVGVNIGFDFVETTEISVGVEI